MSLKRNNFLSNILSPDHRAAGLHLQEDDHCVALFHEESRVAEFTSNATVESLRLEADQWLNLQKSGVTFAKPNCSNQELSVPN